MWTWVWAGLLVVPACEPDTCSGDRPCHEPGAYRCEGSVVYHCGWVTTDEGDVDGDGIADECRELVWHAVDCSDPLGPGCGRGPECN